MLRSVILLGGLLVLALVNYSIYEREQLRDNGRMVLLELAPVDPRSLMQGDYMALRFALQTEVIADQNQRDGRAILAVDSRGVARFRRLDNGSALAPAEVRLFFRIRNGEVRLDTDAFFFQEGDADLFKDARYGEVRVNDSGQMVLTGLRDESLRKLGPVR